VYNQCAVKVSLAAQFMSHNEGAEINTVVSAGKQQCLHLFSFQNNEAYVVHAVQLVQFYITYIHDIQLIMPHSLIRVVL